MKFVILALAVCFQSHAQVPLNKRILLTPENTIVFRGEVTDESAMLAQIKLAKLVAIRGANLYPLYLVLDSPGGSIDAGLGFIEFAKVVRNLKTISIFAASMASGIVEALPGERLVVQNGTLMFHRAAGTFRGYFETGEVESQLMFGKSIMRQMENVNASRMRRKIMDYKELVRSELWLYSTNNLTFRAADKVVDIVCSQRLIDSRTTVSFESLFGLGTVSFSGCPLFRSPSTGDTAKYVLFNYTNYNLFKNFELNRL